MEKSTGIDWLAFMVIKYTTYTAREEKVIANLTLLWALQATITISVQDVSMVAISGMKVTVVPDSFMPGY